MGQPIIRFLSTQQETEEFGKKLWCLLPYKCLVFLKGQLGAGKTTLVRGFLRAAGFSGTVKSPTYTLVEEYVNEGRKIFHFDLYRLRDPEELEWIGIRDYLDQNSTCFFEWPDVGEDYLPEPDVIITFRNKGIGRELTITSKEECKNIIASI